MAKGILKEIIDAKKLEVEEKQKSRPLKELVKSVKPAERNFKQAIESKRRPINLIAEIKKASPLEGVLREKFDVKEIASIYEKHAQAISVVTDEKFFQGNSSLIRDVKSACQLPVLRKDFVIDEYNIKKATPINEEVVIEFTADKAGEFVYYCSMPNHRQLGQWGTLLVTE